MSSSSQNHPHVVNLRASLIAQLIKNLPAMQETLVRFLCRKIPWRRDGLPTPVFLGFPGGSDGKESGCNAGDLGLLVDAPDLGCGVAPLGKQRWAQ